MSKFLGKIKVNSGETYGLLTVIKEAERHVQPSGLKVRRFLCKCECGKETTVRLIHLRKGAIKSCGCIKGESHGEVNTPLYNVWRGMKNRCGTDTYIDHHRYKDRGITVCNEWKKSFKAFKDWALSNGYKEGLQIDRKENNGNYEPSNCRFVTNIVNVNNREITVTLTYKGRQVSLMEIIREVGINEMHASTIRTRLNRGWDGDKAVDTPFTLHNKKIRCAHSKHILQYDTKGKFLKQFTSIAEAGRSVRGGRSSIDRYLKGEAKRIDFIWKLAS